MVNVQGSVIRLCQRALPEELDTLLHRVDGISGLAGLAQQGPRRGGGGSSSIGGGSLERRRLARLDATRYAAARCVRWGCAQRRQCGQSARRREQRREKQGPKHCLFVALSRDFCEASLVNFRQVRDVTAVRVSGYRVRGALGR